MVSADMARTGADTRYSECSLLDPDQQMPPSHERPFPLRAKSPALGGIPPRLRQRFEEPIWPVGPAHLHLSQRTKSARHHHQLTRQSYPSAKLHSLLLRSVILPVEQERQ